MVSIHIFHVGIYSALKRKYKFPEFNAQVIIVWEAMESGKKHIDACQKISAFMGKFGL